MGWDANSSVVYNKKSLTIKNIPQRIWFSYKSKECIEKYGSVDCGLENGWLDCSTCKLMLQEATGESCYTDWDSDKVKNMHTNWKFKYDKEDAWAYWSARYFLDGCKIFGLSVNFSF